MTSPFFRSKAFQYQYFSPAIIKSSAGVGRSAKDLVDMLSSAANRMGLPIEIGIRGGIGSKTSDPGNIRIDMPGRRPVELMTNMFDAPVASALLGGRAVDRSHVAGLTRLGSNIYIGPGLRVGRDGLIKNFIESYAQEVVEEFKAGGVESIHQLHRKLITQYREKTGDRAAALFDISGPRIMPALYASHNIDVNNLVIKDIKGKDRKFSVIAAELMQKQLSLAGSFRNSDAKYRELTLERNLLLSETMQALKSQGYNIDPLMIREEQISRGIFSTLKPTDVAFSATYQELSKGGARKRMNIMPISAKLLEDEFKSRKSKLSPAVAGKLYGEMSEAANVLAETIGVGGKLEIYHKGALKVKTRRTVNAAQMQTFYAIAETDIASYRAGKASFGAISSLGDSSSFISQRLFNVLEGSFAASQGYGAKEMGSKQFVFSSPGVGEAAVRPELKSVFDAVAANQSDVTINGKLYRINYGESGRFSLDRELRLGATDHLGYDSGGHVITLMTKGSEAKPSAPVRYGVFLGTSAPPEGVPHTLQDIERNKVIVKNARAISFRGGRVLGDGKVAIDVAPVVRRKKSNVIGTAVAGTVEGKATFMVNAEQQLLATDIGTGLKHKVDVIARAADIGLKLTDSGLEASEKFLTGGYLRTIATASRQSNKLEELGKFLGLGYKKGSLISVSSGASMKRAHFGDYLFRDGMEQLTGSNLVKAILKLRTASAADLAKMGLDAPGAKSVIEMLDPVTDSSGNVTGFSIAKNHFSVVEKDGRAFLGISKLMSEINLRYVYRPKKIRPGGMTLRLDNYTRHIEQQVNEYKRVGRPDLKGHLEDVAEMIYKSPSVAYNKTKVMGGHLATVYPSGFKPTVASQVASIASILSGGRMGGGIFGRLGAQKMGVMSVEEMLIDEYERPLTSSISIIEEMVKKPLKISDLPGMQDDVSKNINRGGFLLDLGFNVSVPVGETGEVKTSVVPMPTFDLLGNAPTGTSIYLSGGVRNAHFARRAEIIKTKIAHYSALAKSTGATLESVIPDSLKAEIGSYTSDLISSLQGKGGFLEKAGSVQPKGGISPGKVIHMPLTESMDNALTVSLNEKDFFEIIGKAQGKDRVKDLRKIYEKTGVIDDVFAMLHRNPVHSRHNLLPVRMVIDKGIKQRGIMGFTAVIRRIFGDVDFDELQLMTASGDNPIRINNGIKEMHKYELSKHVSFLKLLKETDDKSVQTMVDKLFATGTMSVTMGEDDFITKAATSLGKSYVDEEVTELAAKMALQQRFPGAAGSNILTEQADKFAKVTSDLITAHAGGEGPFAETHRSLLDVMEQVEGLSDAAGKFRSFSANPYSKQLMSLAGNLQEGLVYSSLKKVELGQLGAMIDGRLVSFGEAMSIYARDKSVGNLDLVRKTFVEGYTRSFTKGALFEAGYGMHLTDLGISVDDYKKLTPDQLSKTVSDKLTTLFDNVTDFFSASADLMSNPRALDQALASRMVGKYYVSNIQNDLGLESGAVSRAFIGEGVDIGPMSAEGMAARNLKLVNAENQAINQAAEEAGEDTLEKASTLLKELWGNKGLMKGAAVVGGVMGGVAIYDSLFGKEEQPAPPIFSNAGAPLPPAASIQMPDANASVPQSFSFASNPRVERPYSMRQVYNVSGSGSDSVDFGGLMSAGSPGINAIPSRSSNIRDSREGMQKRALPYQLREKLNSSF